MPNQSFPYNNLLKRVTTERTLAAIAEMVFTIAKGQCVEMFYMQLYREISFKKEMILLGSTWNISFIVDGLFRNLLRSGEYFLHSNNTCLTDTAV